ncbi:hypothetical protein [Nocardioides marmorisolisilvae]|uniref:Uncharacterized protein n=1 Tax=Nocardioides marmorisolisilvae TaxID=1542737 RepID=A0A3N0DSH2_9ACTN|nr:hypothetical protein [Nocardioides marmorisolisilvae]RNL78574.1 hypothetical protein EFL95_05655 [Nocardioides marmorisolisilvae]
MDRNQYEIVPGTRLANRFLWLVVVPTGACLAVWAVVILGTSNAPIGSAILAALCPVAGLACVVGYRWLTRDVVKLVAYLPVALGALVFGPSIIELGYEVAREPDGAFIPVLPYGVGFLLPFVAFACGLAAFTRVERRTRA